MNDQLISVQVARKWEKYAQQKGVTVEELIEVSANEYWKKNNPYVSGMWELFHLAENYSAFLQRKLNLPPDEDAVHWGPMNAPEFREVRGKNFQMMNRIIEMLRESEFLILHHKDHSRK